MGSGAQVSNAVLSYCKKINDIYLVENRTTEIQIDTLVMLYKIDPREEVFSLLLKTHKGLLLSIARVTYNRYKDNVYEEDLYELEAMVQAEFYRRIIAYKFPPVAPFSKYIKLYMSKWANAYIKAFVRYKDRNELKDSL